MNIVNNCSPCTTLFQQSNRPIPSPSSAGGKIKGNGHKADTKVASKIATRPKHSKKPIDPGDLNNSADIYPIYRKCRRNSNRKRGPRRWSFLRVADGTFFRKTSLHFRPVTPQVLSPFTVHGTRDRYRDTCRNQRHRCAHRASTCVLACAPMHPADCAYN